jgi:hypothetical protein
MPKLSYAQEVATLQETVAAVRSRADVLPPLALTAADEIEATIAEIKALKGRQQAYVAELKVTVEAKQAAMARGMVAARYIRACSVLVYGRKNARLTHFGIRIRRRPRRKAGTAIPAVTAPAPNAQDHLEGRHREIPDAGTQTQVTASPVCRDGADLTAAPDEVWIARSGRANRTAIGGDARTIGGKVDPMGEKGSGDGGNARTVGTTVSPVGAFVTPAGAEASEARGNASAPGGKAQTAGGNLRTDPKAVSLAA